MIKQKIHIIYISCSCDLQILEIEVTNGAVTTVANCTTHDESTLNIRHVSLVLVNFTAVDCEAQSLQQLRPLLILRLSTAKQVQIE